MNYENSCCEIVALTKAMQILPIFYLFENVVVKADVSGKGMDF